MNRILRCMAATGAAIALVACAASPAFARVVEIRMVQTPAGEAYFDPAGIHIAPGDTVRWVQMSGFHSTTAYAPQNGNHELRIPAGAKPWDSDILLADHPKKGSTFEHVFTVPGVYDYFCKPHEMAGMVGRIIVGDPGDGPGTQPFGYAPDRHWNPVPEAAQKDFPPAAEIMRQGVVRAPQAAGK